MPFYAVRKGHTPGIYETWAECQKQTLQFKGAQFKKFDDREQAERFLVDGTAKGKEGVRYSPYNINHKKDAKKATGTASKSKVCATTPEEVEDDGEAATVVYTDGCCNMNGKKGACGGIGVYWGEDDPRNLSEKLEGRQTNNRAEIEACCRALEQAKSQGIKKLEIRTDSAFMINAMTTWIDGWKKRNWKTATNEPVKNADDFKRLDECQKGVKIIWTHVAGHSGILGNEAADLLAKNGAKKPSKEETDD